MGVNVTRQKNRTTGTNQKSNLPFITCMRANGTRYVWTGGTQRDTGHQDEKGKTIYQPVILHEGDVSVQEDHDRYQAVRKEFSNLMADAKKRLAKAQSEQTGETVSPASINFNRKERDTFYQIACRKVLGITVHIGEFMAN